MVQLRWCTGVWGSCLHAAFALKRPESVVDKQLVAGLERPARRLRDAVARLQWGSPPIAAWHQLFDQSTVSDSAAKIAASAGGSTSHAPHSQSVLVEQLADSLEQMREALLRHVDQLPAQMQLRKEPLIAQWHARGPGMLRAALGLMGLPWKTSTLRVLLVYPVQGGFGTTHGSFSSLRMEAVLVDCVANLPESVRLAWLVVTSYCQHKSGPNVPPDVLQLATIPPVLQAASCVELARCDEPTVAMAMENWLAGQTLPLSADQLARWWASHHSRGAAWPEYVAQLEKTAKSNP